MRQLVPSVLVIFIAAIPTMAIAFHFGRSAGDFTYLISAAILSILIGVLAARMPALFMPLFASFISAVLAIGGVALAFLFIRNDWLELTEPDYRSAMNGIAQLTTAFFVTLSVSITLVSKILARSWRRLTRL